MKHLHKFNEELEDDFERTDHSDESTKVKVKDIIEFLSGLDPELEVVLDKNGWNYKETGLKTVENAYLFYVRPNYLIINN
jgi:hypothetical protein